MRIGYGFGRTSADFGRAKVTRVYIDTAFTDRDERRDMLQHGLRSGDTVVVLALGDLGKGADYRAVLRRLHEAGCKVEVLDKTRKPETRGRPKAYDPTTDQDARIRELWYADGIYQMKHVLQRAEEIYGKPVTRAQLDHRYGPRNGSMPGGRERKNAD